MMTFAKRYFIALLMLSLPFVSADAYTLEINDSATTAALAEINRIKLNPKEYLYAEITMKDWQDAYETAKTVLKENLTSWLIETKGSESAGCIAVADEKLFEVKAKRGDMFRAFVYVKKSDIIAYAESRQVIAVNIPDSVKNVIDNSAEKPVTTAPKKAEPKKEEANAPVIAEPAGKADVKAVEKTEEKPVEKPKPEVLYKPTEFERQMLIITMADDIQNFIKEKISIGKISEYGKYVDRPKSGTYYLFIYNKEKRVPACLKCVNDKLINIATGRADSFQNYKNCGAIWFK